MFPFLFGMNLVIEAGVKARNQNSQDKRPVANNILVNSAAVAGAHRG